MYVNIRFATEKDLEILEEYRGRGIGTKMLEFLESFLLSNGRRVLLSSSQVNEIEPQAWHRLRGFKECGILFGINEGGVGYLYK
ncbi:GNAT family N-acetyltransferase [Fonticella tunisiensis]|uniref:Acetyltransferase (GNAT) family protein n=1 Tax=Fonticella tunisiensis TaxID=1096341 RepID=A0A4R7KA84_9CLOT|nr:GNAT family N-acetyltransferase [Fonticella tunisiensis]TDT51274.1 acetyltransferase (GNAT) family protein [Fonticella tunisiensis]